MITVLISHATREQNGVYITFFGLTDLSKSFTIETTFGFFTSVHTVLYSMHFCYLAFKPIAKKKHQLTYYARFWILGTQSKLTQAKGKHGNSMQSLAIM